MVQLDILDLGEEIDFGFPFFHLFVEDLLKGSGPATVVPESNNFVVEFLLPLKILG